ncbi:methyltransferase domain-containing protein [Liquorilactobacillus mali]|uniref:methyltransferase domain-containing protein n=1 Tax=Liquorilactobacillus mali TaxID=1618 RepID=UPI00234FE6EC|nr:methyltransferase domain-containing protein [Liquorilactobacillus mali]MDC7952385.1 methyltransferase domain-containing protein [Liquorilactobacillus mali]
MKKIEKKLHFVAQNIDMFVCPVCRSSFVDTQPYSVICKNGHNFDFSKKGTLYLLTHQITSDYDDDRMWNSRAKIQAAGFFEPIAEKITSIIGTEERKRILDVGCGEGSTLSYIENKRQNSEGVMIGFDISKRAINLAAKRESDAFYCIADLAKLPFNKGIFDIVIDMFSPSSYSEFKRVLAPGGSLIKIIPNSNYLIELRHLLYDEGDKNYSYSNHDVLELFKENYPAAEIEQLRYSFKLTPELFENLVYMTPLHWGADSEKLEQALSNKLNEITIDVSVLVVKS